MVGAPNIRSQKKSIDVMKGATGTSLSEEMADNVFFFCNYIYTIPYLLEYFTPQIFDFSINFRQKNAWIILLQRKQNRKGVSEIHSSLPDILRCCEKMARHHLGGLTVYMGIDILHRLPTAKYNKDDIEAICIVVLHGNTQNVIACIYKDTRVQKLRFVIKLF